MSDRATKIAMEPLKDAGELLGSEIYDERRIVTCHHSQRNTVASRHPQCKHTLNRPCSKPHLPSWNAEAALESSKQLALPQTRHKPVQL